MKMMNILVNNFKVNILPAQNESGGHVWDGLFYIWSRNFFILSIAEKVQNRNFWKQYTV